MENGYLTYEMYKGLGGTLDLASFNLLEYEARRKIDERTFGRLKKVESKEIPFEVKMCEFKIINSLTNYDSNVEKVFDNNLVANENIDGYSVSYITADKIGDVLKIKNSEIDDIIHDYLIDVVINNEHILYLGV